MGVVIAATVIFVAFRFLRWLDPDARLLRCLCPGCGYLNWIPATYKKGIVRCCGRDKDEKQCPQRLLVKVTRDGPWYRRERTTVELYP